MLDARPQPSPLSDPIYSESETAEFLSLKPCTLRKWRPLKKGPPHVRIGARRIGYRASEVLSWIDSQQQATPA